MEKWTTAWYKIPELSSDFQVWTRKGKEGDEEEKQAKMDKVTTNWCKIPELSSGFQLWLTIWYFPVTNFNIPLRPQGEWGNRGTCTEFPGWLLRHPLCEQTGSIDFVCITEGYRSVWNVKYSSVESLWKSTPLRRAKLATLWLMNFNSFADYHYQEPQAIPLPKLYQDTKVTETYNTSEKRHLVVTQDW